MEPVQKIIIIILYHVAWSPTKENMIAAKQRTHARSIIEFRNILYYGKAACERVIADMLFALSRFFSFSLI